MDPGRPQVAQQAPAGQHRASRARIMPTVPGQPKSTSRREVPALTTQ